MIFLHIPVPVSVTAKSMENGTEIFSKFFRFSLQMATIMSMVIETKTHPWKNSKMRRGCILENTCQLWKLSVLRINLLFEPYHIVWDCFVQVDRLHKPALFIYLSNFTYAFLFSADWPILKKSEILTSSPVKKACRKWRLSGGLSLVRRLRNDPRKVPTKRKLRAPRKMTHPSVLQTTVCNETYVEPPSEDWLQCIQCSKWYHEKCGNDGNLVGDLCLWRFDCYCVDVPVDLLSVLCLQCLLPNQGCSLNCISISLSAKWIFPFSLPLC